MKRRRFSWGCGEQAASPGAGREPSWYCLNGNIHTVMPRSLMPSGSDRRGRFLAVGANDEIGPPGHGAHEEEARP